MAMVTVLLIGGQRIGEIVNYDHGSREPLRPIIDFLGQLELIQKNKSKHRGGGGMAMLMKEKKPDHKNQSEEDGDNDVEQIIEESSLEEVEDDDAVDVEVADANEAEEAVANQLISPTDVCSEYFIFFEFRACAVTT